MNIKKTLAGLTLTLGLACPGVLLAEETNNWSFQVAPYLWVASFGAESSLPPTVSGMSASAQEFDTHISAGFMLAAQARYRSVGVLADFNWLQLDTESLNPGTLYSGVNLKSDFIYSTAALTYALPLRGKFQAEVIAGARIWNVSNDLEFESGVLPGYEASDGETWVSPLLGANMHYDLTRHWLLLARGTVGGFAQSSIQWDVFGGVGYRFSDWCLATIGYRYLHENFEQDDFTFNAEVKGALIGVVFQF